MAADLDLVEITRYNWILFAACAGKSVAFFRPDDCKSMAEDRERRLYCQILCDSCPVRRFCIEDELDPNFIRSKRFSMSRGGWEWDSRGTPHPHPDDADLYEKFYGKST